MLAYLLSFELFLKSRYGLSDTFFSGSYYHLPISHYLTASPSSSRSSKRLTTIRATNQMAKFTIPHNPFPLRVSPQNAFDCGWVQAVCREHGSGHREAARVERAVQWAWSQPPPGHPLQCEPL